MRALSFGLAPLAAAATAIAVPAAPAKAQFAAGPGAAAPVAPSFHGRFGDHRRADKDDSRHRHDRRRHRDFRGQVVVGGLLGPPEAWALYNNRSWEADSFNDWWHAQPWRSYPRWMQSNQNCDRMWWGGGAWRCEW